jgi:hypothetical protein
LAARRLDLRAVAGTAAAIAALVLAVALYDGGRAAASAVPVPGAGVPETVVDGSVSNGMPAPGVEGVEETVVGAGSGMLVPEFEGIVDTVVEPGT